MVQNLFHDHVFTSSPPARRRARRAPPRGGAPRCLPPPRRGSPAEYLPASLLAFGRAARVAPSRMRARGPRRRRPPARTSRTRAPLAQGRPASPSRPRRGRPPTRGARRRSASLGSSFETPHASRYAPSSDVTSDVAFRRATGTAFPARGVGAGRRSAPRRGGRLRGERRRLRVAPARAPPRRQPGATRQARVAARDGGRELSSRRRRRRNFGFFAGDPGAPGRRAPGARARLEPTHAGCARIARARRLPDGVGVGVGVGAGAGGRRRQRGGGGGHGGAWWTPRRRRATRARVPCWRTTPPGRRATPKRKRRETSHTRTAATRALHARGHTRGARGRSRARALSPGKARPRPETDVLERTCFLWSRRRRRLRARGRPRFPEPKSSPRDAPRPAAPPPRRCARTSPRASRETGTGSRGSGERLGVSNAARARAARAPPRTARRARRRRRRATLPSRAAPGVRRRRGRGGGVLFRTLRTSAAKERPHSARARAGGVRARARRGRRLGGVRVRRVHIAAVHASCEPVRRARAVQRGAGTAQPKAPARQ